MSGCATGPDCINPSEAMKRKVDFGSPEAETLYDALPKLESNTEFGSLDAEIISKTTLALENYTMTPEGQTQFLRSRLDAYTRQQLAGKAKGDVERLIALDRLSNNEAPYLLASLDRIGMNNPHDYDQDAKPLVRFPPAFPKNISSLKNSAHCKLYFDVGTEGAVENINVGYCTDDRFREGAVKSLASWKYNPAIHNGEPVIRKNVETKIAFQINDACGNILPE